MKPGDLFRVIRKNALFSGVEWDPERDDELGQLLPGDILVYLDIFKNPLVTNSPPDEADEYCNMFKVLTRLGIGWVNDDGRNLEKVAP